MDEFELDIDPLKFAQNPDYYGGLQDAAFVVVAEGQYEIMVIVPPGAAEVEHSGLYRTYTISGGVCPEESDYEAKIRLEYSHADEDQITHVLVTVTDDANQTVTLPAVRWGFIEMPEASI